MATASVRHLYTGGTSAVLYSERRDFPLKPAQFDELYKSVTPLLELAAKKRVTGLKDPVYKMFEHKNPWERRYMVNNGSTVTIAAGSTGAAAESDAVTFDGITGMNATIDTSYVHQMFEVWDSTGTTKKGVVLLTDDTSSTTAKFKNAGTTAISTVDGDLFVHITSAEEDGSEAPDAWSDELTIVWNQCQQIKTAVQIEGDLYYAALKGANNELARLRLQKLGEHKKKIEGALMKGKSLLGTNLSESDTFTDLDKFTGDNSKVVRTTYGLIPIIEDLGSTSGTNQNNFSVTAADYEYADFVDDMEKWFAYDNEDAGTKVALAGPGAISFWSKMSFANNSNNWQVVMSDTKTNSLGWKIRKLETPHGDIDLKKTYSLKYEYNNYMVSPDPNHLSLYQYRPDQFKANIKTDNAYDGEKDMYFSQVGLGLTQLYTHKLMKIV